MLAFQPCAGMGDSKGDAVATWLVLAGPLHSSCPHPGCIQEVPPGWWWPSRWWILHALVGDATTPLSPGALLAGWKRWLLIGCSSAESTCRVGKWAPRCHLPAPPPLKPGPPFHRFHPKAFQLLQAPSRRRWVGVGGCRGSTQGAPREEDGEAGPGVPGKPKRERSLRCFMQSLLLFTPHLRPQPAPRDLYWDWYHRIDTGIGTARIGTWGGYRWDGHWDRYRWDRFWDGYHGICTGVSTEGLLLGLVPPGSALGWVPRDQHQSRHRGIAPGSAPRDRIGSAQPRLSIASSSFCLRRLLGAPSPWPLRELSRCPPGGPSPPPDGGRRENFPLGPRTLADPHPPGILPKFPSLASARTATPHFF